MSEIRRSLLKRVKLRIPGKLSRAALEEVDLRIEVSAVEQERRFSGLALEVRAPSNLVFAIDPSSVAVEVTGAQEVVSRLEEHSLAPYVKLEEGMKKGERVAVMVDLPEGVSLVAIEPREAKVVELGVKEKLAAKEKKAL